MYVLIVRRKLNTNTEVYLAQANKQLNEFYIPELLELHILHKQICQKPHFQILTNPKSSILAAILAAILDFWHQGSVLLLI